MADQTSDTSDPVQDAGLVSPPIQGIEDPYTVKTTHDDYHPPVTNPPEEGQQGQETQPPSPEQPSEPTPSSDVTPPTAEQAETPVDQPYPGTPTDATGDESSDLA